jgi:hypothetical protein
MTRMLDLRNILELVDNGSFTEQELVREMHETIFHVFAQPSDEMESLFKEQLGQGSRNVAAIRQPSLPRSPLTMLGTGLRSSTLPGVRQQANSSPRSLTARCSLKP